MPEKTDFRPIYGHIFSHCEPFHHDGPWQQLSAPDDIRRVPADPATVMNDLRQHFCDGDLQKAGAIGMDETLTFQMDPGLRNPGAVVIALRRRPNEKPFDLLTECGTLSGKRLPVCASLSDGRIRAMIGATEENVLLVTPSPIDVAVLLSLKIPTTLATGLRTLEGVYLRQVRKRFELRRPPPQCRGIIDHAEEERRKRDQPPDIVLVGCRLAEMSREEPTDLAPIVSHLTKVEQYLDVPLDRFFIWRPTEDEVRSIEFHMKHVGPKDTRAAILGSIETSTAQLIAPAKPSDDFPKDLSTAIRQLAQHRGDSMNDPTWDWGPNCREKLRQKDREWEQRASENIQRLIGKSCLDSMLKMAQSSEDIVERNLWMIAAFNGEVSYSQAMRILLMANRAAKDKKPGKAITFPKEEFRQWMETTDRELKVLKEIQACRQNPFRGWKKHRS
jgi:hypothetical protein